jgi:uncharacterized membrane protein YeaQ/YmgE (transglycosylase-associated protein family)
MQILWMLLIGLIVGTFAKLIMPGKERGALVVTMVVGVAGSIIFGALAHASGWYAQGRTAGYVASVMGALIVVGVYRLLEYRGEPGGHGPLPMR